MTTSHPQDASGQRERNDKALTAWNEWKEMCAVGRCAQSNQECLRGAIKMAWLNKLKSCIAPESTTLESAMAHCVEEFDAAIWERKAPRRGENAKAFLASNPRDKTYKSFVWFLAARSNEPALKVIRGKLTGEKGLINEIVLNYLQHNELALMEERSGRRMTPASEEERESMCKGLEDSVSPSPGSSTMEAEANADLAVQVDQLTVRDAALALATSCDMPVSHPSLLACAGCKKSALFEYRNNTFLVKMGKMLSEYRDILSDTRVLDFLREKILKEAPEKEASTFLHDVDAAMASKRK